MKALLLALLATATPVAAQDYRQRLPQDEVIYFVLPDGSRMATPPMIAAG